LRPRCTDDPDPAALVRLRRAKSIGRPVGEDAFLEWLEAATPRLRRASAGRKRDIDSSQQPTFVTLIRQNGYLVECHRNPERAAFWRNRGPPDNRTSMTSRPSYEPTRVASSAWGNRAHRSVSVGVRPPLPARTERRGLFRLPAGQQGLWRMARDSTHLEAFMGHSHSRRRRIGMRRC
jgi:hypothetical protein